MTQNTKKKKRGETGRKSKRRKTRKEVSDSSSESESEDECICVICTDSFANSRPREKWVKCVACNQWAHKECTEGTEPFLCIHCDEDDDN